MDNKFLFYDDTVTLTFDKEEHAYFLETSNGPERLAGVTTISNILDHSMYLLPWGCKMMYLKLLKTVPRYMTFEEKVGEEIEKVAPMTWAEFDKIAQEAKSAHREHFEDAGDVGNMAHAWIEESIKYAIRHNDGIVEKMHPSAPDDERAINCGLAAFKWMQEHNVRWVSTERKCYSRKWKYAGTLDGLALVDSCDDPNCCQKIFLDELSVIDWKSSNQLSISYNYQTAGYLAAILEEFGKSDG